MIDHPFHIRAVLFDFDGTLTHPGAHDWRQLREELGCPSGTGVLEYIDGMADPQKRQAATDSLEAFEAAAAAKSEPAEGAEELVEALRHRGLKVGIMTRNSLQSVTTAMSRFGAIGLADFDPVITREARLAPKPDPDGVLHAARHWGIGPEQVLVVGDFFFDIEAGRRAGAVTALLEWAGRPDQPEADPDFRISALPELIDIVRLGTPMDGGKLPNDLLESFLSDFPAKDPDLLVAAGVGQDTAAVALDGGRALVLKSDPITFVTEAIAEYAVVVNANDIATAGAVPRWLLTTLLFPPGTTPSQIRGVMAELHEVCAGLGITLCGGHTEITDAVTRPVVTGMLCGMVDRHRIIDKRNMRPGDRIVMTKRIAVEGTAIIAREFAGRLSGRGVGDSTIRRAAGFLPRISILEEARIAAQAEGVSAMHDVTEGGLATAMEELAAAGGHRFRVRIDRIPVFPETEKICRAVGIDPMGLIGSGSLLITCRPGRTDALVSALREAEIEASVVGEVLGPGRGIEAADEQGPVAWPAFEADELTRLF